MATGATAITHPERGFADVDATVLDAVLDLVDDTNNPVAGTTGVQPAVFTATDPDMVRNVADTDDEIDRLTWSTAGPDGSKFNITAAEDDARMATLSFKKPANFEAKADADGNNMYEVTVVVTDSRANTGTKNVTVQVTNDEEDGAVVVSLLHPQVGTMLVASLSDPDGDVSGVEWQWWRSDSGDGATAAGSVPDATGLGRMSDNPNPNADSPVWDKIASGTSSSYRPVRVTRASSCWRSRPTPTARRTWRTIPIRLLH